MTKINEQEVLKRLRDIKLPSSDQNIVSKGMVSGLTLIEAADGVQVIFMLEVDPAEAASMEPVRLNAEQAVAQLEGVASASVVLTAHRKSPEIPVKLAAASTTRPVMHGIKHVVVIASGKGGVGKSTTSVNLAVALAKEGQKVGLLDADLFGPSVPRMMAINARPDIDKNNKIIPVERCGVKAMSIGSFIDDDVPVIWRGPMLHSALKQLLHDVAWGDLDVLLIDLPPGTGDTHISISQLVSLSGAVIVSTPQDIALLDARRCIGMLQRVEVPILGVIENMSYFLCPHCGGQSDIFNHGGAESEAKRLDLPFLGRMPLDLLLRETSDSGTPIVHEHPDGAHAKLYRAMARLLIEALASEGLNVQR